MGHDVGAMWMGAAQNKINAELKELMEWEQACQEGRASPNHPPEHLRDHPSLWGRQRPQRSIEEPEQSGGDTAVQTAEPSA
jgi:hypothetical protein